MTLSGSRTPAFTVVHNGLSDRAATPHSVRYRSSLHQHARLFDNCTRSILSAIGTLTPSRKRGNSVTAPTTFGRSIQLFLVDGTPTGLIIASIHGWTGSVLVSTQSTFGDLLRRPEVDRTGIYLLYGPDPEDSLRMRVYVGEADSVRARIADSAGKRAYWEKAVVVTTSDEALTKGHVRYLEARLIEMTKEAGRVVLDNSQMPDADRRRLPEADRANMEAFLANLKIILPVVDLELLKPRPQGVVKDGMQVSGTPPSASSDIRFEVRHKSGVKAVAVEEEGEFVVLEGSEALKDTDYARNSYAKLKEQLIASGILEPTADGQKFRFTRPYAFHSPSAAGSVVLDRNTNGRTRWYLVGSDLTYDEWQKGQASDGDQSQPAEL